MGVLPFLWEFTSLDHARRSIGGRGVSLQYISCGHTLCSIMLGVPAWLARMPTTPKKYQHLQEDQRLSHT